MQLFNKNPAGRPVNIKRRKKLPGKKRPILIPSHYSAATVDSF
jgi:hypothetical protein